MITFLLRTAKYAFQDFWRNFWLSLITVTVIFIALFSFNSLILVKTVSEYTLETIENKIDVSVFINPGTEEAVIMDLRARILGLEQVKEVIYVSAKEALDSMKDKHKEDQSILQSIEELQENPLGAQLIVRAQSTEEYDPIVALLGDERYSSIIADKNFDEHTIIIDKVAGISRRIRSVASVLTIIFALIALIVVYNTLRVIIYTHRTEIAIMRLVGATKWFIRMPYLWQSLFYALFAIVIFLLIWYPILGLIQPFVNELFVDGSAINLVDFYNINFILLFGGQLLGLLVLLSVASILATSKYSKV